MYGENTYVTHLKALAKQIKTIIDSDDPYFTKSVLLENIAESIALTADDIQDIIQDYRDEARHAADRH